MMHKVSIVDDGHGAWSAHDDMPGCFLQVLQLGTLIRTKQITSVELTSVFQQRLKM